MTIQASSQPEAHVLRPGASLGSELARALASQYDAALESLADAASGDDAAIHAVRKTTKRLRAMLRLGRDGIGATTYRRENAELRDLSRTIAPARDSYVLIQILPTVADGAANSPEDGIPADILDDLARAAANDDALRSPRHTSLISLDAQFTDGHRKAVATATSPDAIDAMANTLRSARDRATAAVADLPEVPLAPIPDVLVSGITRTYRRARRDHQQAASSSSDETLHRWRKRVKYFRHQLETLSLMISPRHTRAIDELDRLGDLLGFHHDIEMLIGSARAVPAADSVLLVARARVIQTGLRSRALAIADATHVFDAPGAEFAPTLQRSG